jgi:zinc transport system substrate-binding protein
MGCSVLPMKVGTLTSVLVAALAISALSIYLLYAASPPATMEQNKTINVVTTFYPLYDFTKNVGGDKVSVSLLVPETQDVHDFEPTPSIIEQVIKADVLIYNGAGLEPWVPGVLATADNPKLVVVDTSRGITLLPVASAFQRDNGTVDPHIWLDPVDAKQQVQNIIQGLAKADPADAQYFISNGKSYMSRLDALNTEIVNATQHTKTRFFVTFHEAFAYFANRYNLTQVPILGPFQEEPTPSDILNVVAVINKYHLRYVGYESLENPAISESIGTQTNATLVNMNPIEGLTEADKAAGKDYLTLMQDNLGNIKLALNNVG